MAWQNIALSVENDGIALLTVSRPEKLNALNRLTISEIASAVSELSANETVKGVIVTGAGEKAFVAGADISELAEADSLRSIDIAAAGQQLFRRLETLGNRSSLPSTVSLSAADWSWPWPARCAWLLRTQSSDNPK